VLLSWALKETLSLTTFSITLKNATLSKTARSITKVIKLSFVYAEFGAVVMLDVAVLDVVLLSAVTPFLQQNYCKK
jgi:hypothetical protein